jgi:hypothetical protein
VNTGFFHFRVWLRQHRIGYINRKPYTKPIYNLTPAKN